MAKKTARRQCRKKDIQNGGKGYCKTAETQTYADTRDREPIRWNAEYKMEHQINNPTES